MALHSGEVVAGDMGSALKSNYTVLGEPVGTAERLERANRIYGTNLLVSGETQRRAGEEFVFRELDVVTVGGGPQTLYELIGRRGEVPQALWPVLQGWPEALAQVRRRDFAGALAFFEAHAAGDPVSARWAERVRGYQAAPPPPDWDGRGDLRRG
jgi:adenylate cyclase